ncbi:hypothetical protein IWX49DRAFT_553918 [Phyllosticta citricarpa]|uniref:Uncharacterized protein n=2 Tax=Phyllosticta TaxID=121621 RepID=A0ABR1NIY4_9PEZI
MSASLQHSYIEDAPHEYGKYIAINWTTPAGKAHTIQAIPTALLMQFSPGIKQLLTQLPKEHNIKALNFGITALDPNAAGFVLGQLRWSMTTGTPLNFSCRTAHTLERRLQTYKALHVLDIFPFHRTLRKALLNDVYQMTPLSSAAVIREICTNHADDWGFTSSLLANVALRVSSGECRSDVWDCFRRAVADAKDARLEQRFQAALRTVVENGNRAHRNTCDAVGSKAVPRLAQKPSQLPSQVTETDEAQRFLNSESALFDDEE